MLVSRLLKSDTFSRHNPDEVFLLVARGDHADKDKERLRSSRVLNGTDTEALDGKAADDQSVKSRMNLEKEGLFFRHVGAMFKKRAASFRRDKRAWTCTTVLPTLFVLLGLILFKYASPKRNLEPITLNMSALNEGVSTAPINPLPFNSVVNSFTCQPGSCAYDDGVRLTETNEAYTFCGSQVKLDERFSCSISASQDIINTLAGFEGISPQETDVDSIKFVRLSSLLIPRPIFFFLTSSFSFFSLQMRCSKHPTIRICPHNMAAFGLREIMEARSTKAAIQALCFLPRYPNAVLR